jgi:hypothetical protein
LHALLLELPDPGTQSLTAEFVLGLERVSVWSPITAPEALRAVSGNDASIDAVPPFVQDEKLHVCCPAPTVVNVFAAMS